MWPGYTDIAAGSILNAYYTNPRVVDTVWDWLVDHGVVDGHGFEPGCGNGTWMTAAPGSVTIDGVDIDPVSARVAGLMSGQHTEVARIEDWNVARSSHPDRGGYDFAVGNVPFSANRPGRNNPQRDNLHNLAVLRSVEMLRPGGIAALITSRYALDANRSADWRRRLHDQVDLVAAFRLPSGTHRDAGTDVVTDLLILRRPLPDEQRPVPDWLDVATFDVDGTTYTHNAHFAAHPNRVLGDYEAGGAWSETNFSVIGDRPADELLAEQLGALHESGVDVVAYQPHGHAPAMAAAPATTATGRALPAGSIVVDPASSTGFSVDGAEHKVPKSQRAQLGELCNMRDAVLAYLDDPSEDGRAELGELYRRWRDSHQPLNDYTTVYNAKTDKTTRKFPAFGGFRKDPSWWNVAALETYDDDTATASPAPMLQRDTIAATVATWPASAETLTQAVANSMARYHHVDPDYIATQLELTIEETATALTTVAYDDPTTGEWELKAQYLSGDVVGKLDAARAAAADDPERYARNVEALTYALPTPLTSAEIHPELGVTWLSAEDMTQFLHDHIGSEYGEILYHPPTGKWSFEGYCPGGSAEFRTSRKSMVEQIVAGCNAKPVTVTKKIDHGDSEITVVDAEATAQEQLCRDNINEALVAWCWADPERAERLTARYNHTFNRYRPVEVDGSHLTLPGLASDFNPRPHQKDVVWRILTAADSGTLMAHGVGAGKTAAMVIAAEEARRSGRVPGTTMFAVPRNMVEQFARDYLRLYPRARIITPQKRNASQTVKEMVADFAARVLTGDFDAAICSHEAFVSIPLTPDAQAEAIRRRLGDFDNVDVDMTASRREQRRIQNMIAKFTAKLESLADAAEDPNASYFDRLPVGMVFVDEAHLAKNIALMSERAGLPMPEPSQRAEGILARADLVRERHGDGAVVMATATPVTNSPAEMWVFARLVSPNALDKADIEHFDAFAANFLSPVETVEHTADQKLKMVTRLADYRNFPDLARMFRSFADVRQTDQLGFDLPAVAGGQATVHLAPPTDQQLTVTDWATERVGGQHINLPDDVRDPIVAILSATRAASLHPATISDEITARWATISHPNLSFTWDEPNPKLATAADKITEIYQRTADQTYPDSTRTGAAQAVFCDQGVPKPGTEHSVYQVLTDLLVDRGVDRDDIVWVHDWKPDLRQPLWDDVRNGNKRIVIGSTAQMGVGVNIQTRLYAAHELTAPYRPDWLTQAEGRMIRQGNSHDTVELHRYVTERTADASAWQILERKARFITTAMSHPDDMTRDLRDESVRSTAEEYAEISALATGDQRHIELATMTGTVDRLERASRAHAAARTAQAGTIRHGTTRIERLTEQIAAIEALTPANEVDATTIGQQILDIPRGESRVTLAGVTYIARRDYEGIRLSIPDTGIDKWIDRDRLQPADGGRGLGTVITNTHEHLPQRIADRRANIADMRRQLDAEAARPVSEHFTRQGELDAARERVAELTAALKPREPRHVDDTGATDADPAAAGVGGHPVYGERTPTTAERYQFAGAYRRHNPAIEPQWGNRAKGAAAWVAAVNALAVDPAKFHPTRTHLVGAYHGVVLAVRTDGNDMHLAPNGHHELFSTLTVPVGSLDETTITDWLAEHKQRATTELAELNAPSNPTPHAEPPRPGAER